MRLCRQHICSIMKRGRFPEVPSMSPRQAIKKLREAGFTYLYTEGSHAFYRFRHIKVPVPKHSRDLWDHERATVKAAIRDAQMIQEMEKGGH